MFTGPAGTLMFNIRGGTNKSQDSQVKWKQPEIGRKKTAQGNPSQMLTKPKGFYMAFAGVQMP